MTEEQRQESKVVWNRIGFDGNGNLPDAETEVLVYDADLDDVVMASLDNFGSGNEWIETGTGDPLPAPMWWTEVPFPEDV